MMNRPCHRKSIRSIAVLIAMTLGLGKSASACAIPVFRYALERWQSDLFEVDVFHRGPLSSTDRAAASALEDHSVTNGGKVNLEVVLCDVDGTLDEDLQTVWQGLSEPSVPYVVVRAPGGRNGSPVIWKGSLTDIPQTWGDTPTERELQRRLLAGDSIVWVVLAGQNATDSDQVMKTMLGQFPTLAEEIPLPPGIGLPGSQLMSAIPLEMRFSVLTVSYHDAVATWLRRCAMAMSRTPVTDAETLVLPVFGRGRALTPLKSEDVDAESLEELSRFLCGACSCQVKELNPGFDLLLAINWDEQLFDPNAPPITSPNEKIASPASDEPELVSIPQGTSPQENVEAPVTNPAPPQAAAANQNARQYELWLPSTGILLIITIAALRWHRVRRV